MDWFDCFPNNFFFFCFDLLVVDFVEEEDAERRTMDIADCVVVIPVEEKETNESKYYYQITIRNNLHISTLKLTCVRCCRWTAWVVDDECICNTDNRVTRWGSTPPRRCDPVQNKTGCWSM